MGQQHLTVRVTTGLVDQLEKKARALRMETGEELTRSDVVKMALEAYTAKTKAPSKKAQPVGELFLDLIDKMEMERSMRGMAREDFAAAVTAYLTGAGADRYKDQREAIELLVEIARHLPNE